ncbi:MAG: LytR C-terminal domain-containing protein [Elusimicrobiota bacterium]|jgi:hypothetical protein|nr:LytR C-terminal domain-containing protein [Elusimicrobiota bacterium]
MSIRMSENNSISFLVIISGNDEYLKESILIWTLTYSKETGVLKILSINPDIAVKHKTQKAKTLKHLFFENQCNVNDFYPHLKQIINEAVQTDFFVNIKFSDFINISSSDGKNIASAVTKAKTQDYILQNLNELEIFELIFSKSTSIFFEMIRRYDSSKTNMSKLSLIYASLSCRFFKPALMFCSVPVKEANARIELDEKNFDMLLTETYFSKKTETNNYLKVEVRNASLKKNAASQAVWFLREKGFDVLDYGNAKNYYDKTLIVDYKGFFPDALKIAKLLKADKIITAFNKSKFYDIGIFIGEDFNLSYSSNENNGDTKHAKA